MWLVVCLETVETRKVCKVSFSANLELSTPSPLKSPWPTAHTTSSSFQLHAVTKEQSAHSLSQQ